MIEIDGSDGEGGGQIIRSALALSIITGKPFRADRVRAGRAKPGLRKQHLSALRAAAMISSAEVSGDREGSTEPPAGLRREGSRQDEGLVARTQGLRRQSDLQDLGEEQHVSAGAARAAARATSTGCR